MSLADDLKRLTKQVTREWAKQRKGEEKGIRTKSARQYVYSDRVNFTDVAEDILPAAYNHASGNGRYSVSYRQLYYACRDAFQKQTGRELQYKYFAGTLLTQYVNRNSEAEGWKLTADARGSLSIPNTGFAEDVPCGTLEIDEHLQEAAAEVDPFDIEPLAIQFPSIAAGVRYRGLLYLEKEGFWPLLEESKIPERYDLAVVSCKGQSVVAVRKLIDRVCGADGGVPLFVLHDFDKAGFEIARCLTTVSEWAETNDRVRYRFENEINVIDLGLRLEDVREYNLASEECVFNGAEYWDLADEDEIAFFRSGRRVELNAFTSPQFIEFLEAKLAEHLPARLIPSDDVLEQAYRRGLMIADVNTTIEQVKAAAEARATGAVVPHDLQETLAAKLARDGRPWDQVVYELARADVQARRRASGRP
jgi:hypothetical protein